MQRKYLTKRESTHANAQSCPLNKKREYIWHYNIPDDIICVYEGEETIGEGLGVGYKRC